MTSNQSAMYDVNMTSNGLIQHKNTKIETNTVTKSKRALYLLQEFVMKP